MLDGIYQQVRCLDPSLGLDQVMDVWINQGWIRSIQPTILDYPTETAIYEGEGLILAPGLVEMYSTSGEPGHEERETLDSLLQSAKAGGFTRIGILPNTDPVIDRPSVIDFLKHKASLYPNSPILHYWGAITQGRSGEQLTEIHNLIQAGVIGLTDNRPIENLNLIRRTLEYCHPFPILLAFTPLNQTLRGKGVIRDGINALRYGLVGDPIYSETIALLSLLQLVEELKTPIHIMKISTAKSVEIIKQAKEKGLPITVSVSWMNLLWDTESLMSYNPNLKVDPPLGNREDKQALIEGVKTGIIDTIVVDHKGYTYEEKTLSFAESPAGVIGLELALPILWSTFVETGEWTALELWKALSLNPRLCLQLPLYTLKENEPVELILFDPKKTWTVGRKSLKSLSLNTPWLGKEIEGKVLHLITNN